MSSLFGYPEQTRHARAEVVADGLALRRLADVWFSKTNVRCVHGHDRVEVVLVPTWSRSGPAAQIPEHDEPGSGQVELYAILEGEAVLRLDGEDHPAPAGTFASLEPAATRSILNRSESTVTALLIGVEPDGGYEPMSWA